MKKTIICSVIGLGLLVSAPAECKINLFKKSNISAKAGLNQEQWDKCYRIFVDTTRSIKSVVDETEKLDKGDVTLYSELKARVASARDGLKELDKFSKGVGQVKDADPKANVGNLNLKAVLNTIFNPVLRCLTEASKIAAASDYVQRVLGSTVAGINTSDAKGKLLKSLNSVKESEKGLELSANAARTAVKGYITKVKGLVDGIQKVEVPTTNEDTAQNVLGFKNILEKYNASLDELKSSVNEAMGSQTGQ